MFLQLDKHPTRESTPPYYLVVAPIGHQASLRSVIRWLATAVPGVSRRSVLLIPCCFPGYGHSNQVEILDIHTTFGTWFTWTPTYPSVSWHMLWCAEVREASAHRVRADSDLSPVLFLSTGNPANSGYGGQRRPVRRSSLGM
jgi:hypothetical protein